MGLTQSDEPFKTKNFRQLTAGQVRDLRLENDWVCPGGHEHRGGQPLEAGSSLQLTARMKWGL